MRGKKQIEKLNKKVDSQSTEIKYLKKEIKKRDKKAMITNYKTLM